MTLAIFLLHFFYIFGTLIAGFGIGYMVGAKKLNLSRLFKREDSE